MLLQIYDSNKLKFDTEMFLDFFKQLSIMLPGWARLKKDLFLKLKYSNSKIRIPHIDENDRRIYEIFNFVETSPNNFTIQQKIALISHLSKLTAYLEVKYLIEILIFDIFKKNEAEVKLIPTESLVSLLESYSRAKFSNKVILGLIILEIDTRMTRLKEL